MSLLLDFWRSAALIVSAAMLAIAHAFQTFGGYAPCHLCLKQREVYWVAAAVALGSIVLVRFRPDPRWRAATNAILGVIFLAGCAIAVFHAGAEWKFWSAPASCSSAGVSGVSAADLQALMNGAKVRPPACDQAPWVFLGLSMAGWNAVASLAFAVLSGLAAAREWRRT